MLGIKLGVNLEVKLEVNWEQKFRIGIPKMHGGIRIGFPKVNGRIRIGLTKVHARFTIGQTRSGFPCNLPPLDFNSRGIPRYHSYYARKALKSPI